MSKASPIQFDPTTIAVLQHAGASWTMLVADVERPVPHIRATEKLRSSDLQDLDALLDRHEVGRVICVLPAASIVCRTCVLPNIDPAELEQALHLQAEAQLLGSAEEHRLGMAVLPAGINEGNRTGLILAWPGEVPFTVPATRRAVTFTPDVAALAALLNGVRTQEPLTWVDLHDGSIATAVSHAGGVAFRATREEPADLDTWLRSVERTIAETALNVGHTAEYIDTTRALLHAHLSDLPAGEGRLVIPDELQESLARRITGEQQSAGWWQTYGLSVGVALAVAGPLEKLTNLLAQPPMEAPSIIERIVHGVSHPRTAMKVIVVCLLLIACTPLVASYIRYQALEWRHPDREARKESIDALKEQLSMYSDLERGTWPVSKLLSDIACNTPPGIDLELIRVTHGESISITGVAKRIREKNITATQLVEQMQQHMEQSNLFGNITVRWGDPTAAGDYEFSVRADVLEPYRHNDYEIDQDFEKWTMQARVDNEPPPTQLADAGDDDPGSDNPGEVTANAPDDNGTDDSTPDDSGPALASAGGDDPRDNGGRVRDPRTDFGWGGGEGTYSPGDTPPDGVGSTIEIPDPVTAEQVERMSETQLHELLGQISTARNKASLDDETAERLRNDWKLVWAAYKAKREAN
jgi:hypothetical protein